MGARGERTDPVEERAPEARPEDDDRAGDEVGGARVRPAGARGEIRAAPRKEEVLRQRRRRAGDDLLSGAAPAAGAGVRARERSPRDPEDDGAGSDGAR